MAASGVSGASLTPGSARSAANHACGLGRKTTAERRLAARMPISHAVTGDTKTAPREAAAPIASRLRRDIGSPFASQIAAQVSRRIDKAVRGAGHRGERQHRGIEDGDLVELYNGRGALIAGARVTDKIMKGVVSLEEGSWMQLDSRGRCNNGAINVITTSIASSSLSQATAANTCVASLKRCVDPETPNRAFEPPAIERGKKLAVNAASARFAERAAKLRGMALSGMPLGERLFYERCTLCHAPQEPGDFTRKQWQGITDVMFRRTNLSPAEKEAVLEFLEAHAKDAGTT